MPQSPPARCAARARQSRDIALHGPVHKKAAAFLRQLLFLIFYSLYLSPFHGVYHHASHDLIAVSFAVPALYHLL